MEHDLKFTDEEIDAMTGWAGMAGVGFTFGLQKPNPADPSETALAKLTKIESGSVADGS